MLLISPNQQFDKSRPIGPIDGPRQLSWRKPATTAAVLLMSLSALPAPLFAQHGGGFGGGFFGGMINQSLQPAPQYYQSPPPYQPPYQQSYQQPPYPQQYQPPQYQQQTDPYPQYKEAERPRQKHIAATPVRKRKAQTEVTTAANPAPTGVITVKMKKNGGTFEIPVRINNAVSTDFTVDSGASDVMIPADVVAALIKSGALKQEDYIGGQTFTLADGSKLPSVRFKLASLQVGDQTLTDVVASVAPSAGSALLGQSFLSRFRSWTLDNTAGTLTLTMPSANTQEVAAASPPGDTTNPAPAATGPVTAAPATTAPAAPAEPADTAKPASDEITPNKAAAVSTASGAGAHTPVTLPEFPEQTSYADARAHLTALGYEPRDRQQCDPDNKSCFPERVSCFGTDVIQCKFEWTHGDTAISVQTVNYPPTVAKIECEQNCE
jgi:clan AA aspartic protease (TIGR02281 family)